MVLKHPHVLSCLKEVAGAILDGFRVSHVLAGVGMGDKERLPAISGTTAAVDSQLGAHSH